MLLSCPLVSACGGWSQAIWILTLSPISSVASDRCRGWCVTSALSFVGSGSPRPGVSNLGTVGFGSRREGGWSGLPGMRLMLGDPYVDLRRGRP